MITVYYNGKPYQYADSTKYLELARTLQPQFEHDIVLASVNGKLQELCKFSYNAKSGWNHGIQKKRRASFVKSIKRYYFKGAPWQQSGKGGIFAEQGVILSF